jgi:hypothetical protein
MNIGSWLNEAECDRNFIAWLLDRDSAHKPRRVLIELHEDIDSRTTPLGGVPRRQWEVSETEEGTGRECGLVRFSHVANSNLVKADYVWNPLCSACFLLEWSPQMQVVTVSVEWIG